MKKLFAFLVLLFACCSVRGVNGTTRVIWVNNTGYSLDITMSLSANTVPASAHNIYSLPAGGVVTLDMVIAASVNVGYDIAANGSTASYGVGFDYVDQNYTQVAVFEWPLNQGPIMSRYPGLTNTITLGPTSVEWVPVIEYFLAGFVFVAGLNLAGLGRRLVGRISTLGAGGDV